MRLARSVGPVSEERRVELKAQLDEQKHRLAESSQRALAAIKTDLSVMSWIRAYPIQFGVLIVMGGFVTARMMQTRRRSQPLSRSEPYSEVA